MVEYRETRLWQNSLGADSSEHATARELLRTSYHDFWERTARVVDGISHDFPDLTLHDTTHLASLWERAGQLLGDHVSLNPLEAYVLGGAILLHDAGHALRTFPGGKRELEESLFYKDALTAELKSAAGVQSLPKGAYEGASQEAKSRALFYAVRKLHAQKAEGLAFQRFGDTYLISDERLRTSFGSLIGKIAASHNWNRSSISTRIPADQGAPNFLPSEWGFNAQRLAFLLRCADAIQIDQGRAPHFAFALQQPTGQSRLHWAAQQLGQPRVVSGVAPSALVFTSLQDFAESDADAWWIAFDLINVAYEELQECYLVMKDLGLPTFSANRVLGARRPEELAQYVRTDGWRPIKAEIKISNPARIIEMFGGSQLYGANPVVPLRELIQNAADAVRIRRAVSVDRTYRGAIHLSLRDTGDDIELIVSDNGLGMSEYVLSNTLIEFGQSFLSSEDVQNDLPGLIGLNLGLIGRFGIGFFSVFMLSNNVTVISRRYDADYTEARSLQFRNGIYSRPLVSKTNSRVLEGFSTKVALNIKRQNFEKMLIVNGGRPNEYVSIEFSEVLRQLCSGLDCEVSLTLNKDGPVVVHRENWIDEDVLEFLKAAILYSARSKENLDDFLQKAATFVTVIKNLEGKVLGRACVNFAHVHAGLELIGGLASGRGTGGIFGQSEQYVGTLEFEADGPSRMMYHLPDKGAIASWATDQAKLLGASSLQPAEKYLAALNVAVMGGDPFNVGHILLNREFTSLSDVAQKLKSGVILYMPVDKEYSGETKMKQLSHSVRSAYSIVYSYKDIEFTTEVLEPWSAGSHHQGAYHTVEAIDQNLDYSFLSLLKRILSESNDNLYIDFQSGIQIARYVGPSSEREKLVKGSTIVQDVLALRCSNLML